MSEQTTVPYGFTIQIKDGENGEWSKWKDHIYKTENYANGALKIAKVPPEERESSFRVLALYTNEN